MWYDFVILDTRQISDWKLHCCEELVISTNIFSIFVGNNCKKMCNYFCLLIYCHICIWCTTSYLAKALLLWSDLLHAYVQQPLAMVTLVFLITVWSWITVQFGNLRILIRIQCWITVQVGHFIEIILNMGFNNSTSKELGIFDNVLYGGIYIYCQHCNH